MKKLIFLLALLWAFPAWAQNPTCPTRPAGDVSNACASTAFVHNGFAPIPTSNYTINLPLIGNGTPYPVQGTRSGTTTIFGTVSGTPVSGNCVSWNSGDLIDAGAPCGSGGGGGSGTVTAGLSGQIAFYPADGTTVAGEAFPGAPGSGGSGSAQNTTANCTASSASVTLASAIDFVNGQGIALEHCGATFAGAAPTGLAVSKNGPSGSTHYAYQISCLDAGGGVGAAVGPVTITNGYATLGTILLSSRQFSYNNVSWSTSCPAIAVWRSTAGGAYQLLGAFRSSMTFTDSGLPQVTIPWIPATPPASALNDRLVTTISSGAGTTSIVVANAAGNSATGTYTRHDDTAALNAYLSANSNAHLPAGTFNIEAITLPTSVVAFHGEGASATILSGWTPSNTPIVTATGMPNGFHMYDMRISAPAGTVWQDLLVSSTIGCWLQDMGFSAGFGAIMMSSTTRCSVINNHIYTWYQYAIHDQSGTGDTFIGNIMNVGSLPATGEALTLSQTNYSLVEGNSVLGGDYFAYLIDGGSHDKITGNVSLNSNNESYHIAGLSGSASWNQITDNVADSQFYSIDFCISISDDNGNSVIMEENVISGNFLRYCGISAIGLVQLAGASPQFIYNIVTNNVIFASNADSQANTPDIWITGSGFTYTMINGNTFMSGQALVNYNVQETNSGHGTPNHTQVGANFGLVGASGLAQLPGTGSAVLKGGSSGL